MDEPTSNLAHPRKADIINPWQRQECARLLRAARKAGAINARNHASAACVRAMATASYETGEVHAYAFISAELDAVSRNLRRF